MKSKEVNRNLKYACSHIHGKGAQNEKAFGGGAAWDVYLSNSGVIRFATTDPNGIDFRVQEAIRAWNGVHPDCPIEIVDYSVYGGENSAMSAAKLTADIVSGNMPDIYDFSMTSVDTIPSSAQFARRGLLEDLYPI